MQLTCTRYSFSVAVLPDPEGTPLITSYTAAGRLALSGSCTGNNPPVASVVNPVAALSAVYTVVSTLTALSL
jgi:hypothetical protein